ncbi:MULTISPECIES: TadE/TadG family type IV pilus assembly protein [unclassified Ochrobactrum]|uniref:TadE/TadG family type IV pilus assembly protein n=1 Tax=unclassified Ochrobactrum TaxID=239106 RepID=UPI000DEEFCC7|nr:MULTISPECIES: TadE/TadG family type IV pilus assembly protein [unclassified Ochrobactrum]MBQ0710843.1 pilus assembly protein [Ochrobactrum sp. AP1BH01-1]
MTLGIFARRLARVSANLRRFARAQNGVAAVEFALLIVPFLVIIFATIEVGVSFAARQVISNATETVARKLQTGRIRGGAISEEALRTELCQQMQFMVASGCPNLSFNLGTYEGFANVPTDKILDDEGRLIQTGVTGTSGTSTINQLNVVYAWPVLTNILYLAKSPHAAGGTMPLFATLTWQNEPFPN